MVRCGQASSSPTSAGKISRKDFLSGWAEFLAHFSEIEDARFDMERAQLEYAAAQAKIVSDRENLMHEEGTASTESQAIIEEAKRGH